MGGYQPSEWEQQVHLKNQYPDQILTCFGLHPWFVKSDEFQISRHFEDWKIWVDQADFIGEVGLDFFGDEDVVRKEIQLSIFEKQLEISASKPYVLHLVQAHGEALSILKNYSIKGFIHSCSGSIEVAENYMNEGLLLSFGPTILSERFKKSRAALKEIPLSHLLIESDAPSNPLDTSDPIETLEATYSEAAKIRQMDVDELKAQVSTNLLRLLDKK